MRTSIKWMACLLLGGTTLWSTAIMAQISGGSSSGASGSGSGASAGSGVGSQGTGSGLGASGAGATGTGVGSGIGSTGNGSAGVGGSSNVPIGTSPGSATNPSTNPGSSNLPIGTSPGSAINPSSNNLPIGSGPSSPGVGVSGNGSAGIGSTGNGLSNPPIGTGANLYPGSVLGGNSNLNGNVPIGNRPTNANPNSLGTATGSVGTGTTAADSPPRLNAGLNATNVPLNPADRNAATLNLNRSGVTGQFNGGAVSGQLNVDQAGMNRDRYRWHNNQWWYAMPNNTWMYYDNGNWRAFDAATYRWPGNFSGSSTYQPYSTGYRGYLQSPVNTYPNYQYYNNGWYNNGPRRFYRWNR